MQELKKILEEIRVKSIELKNKHWGDDERHLTGKGIEAMCVQVEQIIRKHMNDGWIPVEERLPEDDKYILLSFSNFSLLIVGRYERDEDGSGAFYLGDCDEQDTCIANDLYVNAWQPLPEPYRPERSEEGGIDGKQKTGSN